MIEPQVLADRLRALAGLLEASGGIVWQRVHDWERVGRVPAPGIRGGGTAGGASDRQLEDRLGDRKAGAYATELRLLTARLEADSARVARIIGIVTPPAPDRLGTSELQSAQVAAEGWCVSCWRAEQTLTPVASRRYRDLCRWCGDWRAEHGEVPPVRVVRLRAEGRSVTVAAATRGG